MVSDETYEICLPVLEDSAIEEEDKTDRLEELLRKETTLTGQSLENAVLDVLWRFREGGGNNASPPAIRQTILRRPSPASFRSTATPLSGSPRLGVSPLAPPGFAPPFTRNISSAASPFSSPRPSPRLAFSTPVIPHSPNLNAYEFANDTEPSNETFEDYTSDNVDWLVADDAVSVASSFGASSGLNAAAPEFSLSSQQAPMRPHDVLRSILGESRTDNEISQALVDHGYDLGAVLMSMMETQDTSTPTSADANGYLVGKSMTPDARPTTPADQKSGVICKFFLSSGSCMRADCRFSHDLSGHICRYWLAGNCLAGDTCIFSHDPAHFMTKLNIDGTNTPPMQKSPANIQVQDYTNFPSLGTPDSIPTFTPSLGITPPPGFKNISGDQRSRSRPGSRHQQNKEAAQAALSLDDNEAFPSLGSALAKHGKKHHGKRGGHGHGPKDNYTPSSLADIVKMAPSPGPASSRPDSKKMSRNGSSQGIRNGENSAAAQTIPSPKHIPWLETGEGANKAYMKARGEAHRHGALRNKFLQNAAQAWNRQDARQAKVFSLRGQSENDLMRKYHREAADKLYEERNKNSSGGGSSEIFVDLHGLHTEEAIEYLERVLLENERDERPVYAITGTGHHSKNGKDKVGKAVRNFLNEWRYAFREFSVPGDRNNMGGILGIDASSYDKLLLKQAGGKKREELQPKQEESQVDILSQGVEIGDGKMKLLVRDTTIGKEPPKGPRGGR